MPDYTSLPALKHYVLERSWVLGIEARPGVLEVTLDLAFASDHPDLRPARAGEVGYGRRARISFVGVTTLFWTAQGDAGATDATGERDWGAIDSLRVEDGSYTFEGDFGAITVEANEVEVIFVGPA